MLNTSLGFLFPLVIALVLTACSREDYDPSASETAPTKTQGKAIQGKVIAGNVNADKVNAGKADSSPDQENNGTTDLADNLIGQELPSIESESIEDSNDSLAAQSALLPPLPENSPYREVSFRSISSFPYEVEWEDDGKEPDPTAFLERVPREVRHLSGVKVAVEGFMIPTMVNEENKVTEFLLLPDQMSCCYGKSPAANGWVVVTSDGTDIMMDQIIRVTGSMVVEERWDEEFFVGLYHVSCDDITGPAL